MKSLSKLLIPCLGLICLLSGCETTEDLSSAYYTYKNESSSDITIIIEARSSYPGEFNEYEYYYENHTIPQQSAVTLFYFTLGKGYPTFPLYVREAPGRQSVNVTVSNGEIKVVEYSTYKTGLYDNRNYKLLSTDKRISRRYYEYTFTDAFFENGTPITE